MSKWLVHVLPGSHPTGWKVQRGIEYKIESPGLLLLVVEANNADTATRIAAIENSMVTTAVPLEE